MTTSKESKDKSLKEVNIRRWWVQNFIIWILLAGVLWVSTKHFWFDGFAPNWVNEDFVMGSTAIMFFVILIGGGGLFAFSNLKHYFVLSKLFILPLLVGLGVFVLDSQLLWFVWYFELAQIAQALHLFVILSTKNKPSVNLIKVLVFLFVSGLFSTILVQYDLFLNEMMTNTSINNYFYPTPEPTISSSPIRPHD